MVRRSSVDWCGGADAGSRARRAAPYPPRAARPGCRAAARGRGSPDDRVEVAGIAGQQEAALPGFGVDHARLEHLSSVTIEALWRTQPARRVSSVVLRMPMATMTPARTVAPYRPHRSFCVVESGIGSWLARGCGWGRDPASTGPLPHGNAFRRPNARGGLEFPTPVSPDACERNDLRALRNGSDQVGYSSLRHDRGSASSAPFGVRSARNAKYGATNGSGAVTV